MRAAIYARFSSDKQNERSCQDQIDLCSAWAERQGFSIVDTFRDQAISGASTVNRFGLAQMMRAARLHQFDIVICEALDRLSRDQADLAQIRKDLNFLEIGISTVQDGSINAMHIGLKGLMGEMYLADLAQKTRRGQRARVVAGSIGGGRSFGYDFGALPGEMTVNDREAAVIRRIFADYVAGKNPREIAGDLNREGVLSPRGGKWNASTLAGSKARRNGLLVNRLYIGEIVWNRQRFIKDPATGKRVGRQNPESEWVTSMAEHLAIVDPALFEAAQKRKADRTYVQNAPAPAKPKHLLSGLLKCGCCGASYTVVGRDRLGCAGFKERGDCSNNRTVTRAHIEARVLKALETQLADPDMIAEYVRTYHATRKALAASSRSERDQVERRLAELTRSIDRIVEEVAAGTASKALASKILVLEAEQAKLEIRLAEIEEPDATIALHPAAAQEYRRIVAELQEHVAKMKHGWPAEAVILKARNLIDRIVVTPRESKEPVDLTVHGLLEELLIGSTGAPDVGGRWLRGQDSIAPLQVRFTA